MTRTIELVRILCSVWNVPTQNGTLKVATIEQAPRRESMCAGCSAPCCKGLFQPILSKDEFLSRQFKMQYITPPEWLQPQLESGVKLAVIAGTEYGCVYHNHETNLCTLWPNLPKSCLSYDCRIDDREPIHAFATEREKLWPERLPAMPK